MRNFWPQRLSLISNIPEISLAHAGISRSRWRIFMALRS
jgi:hypothetical protein